MSDGSLRTEDACIKRSIAMKQTAELLWNQGDDWFAVCYFYSAYHLARAAIMTDPIFGEVARLQRTAPGLVPDDRFVTAHKGRVSRGKPRNPGINDVVLDLYPAIAAHYHRLHMASVEVRYQEGLQAIHRDSAYEDFHAVQSAYFERRLVAA